MNLRAETQTKKLKIELTLEVPKQESAWQTTCRVASIIEMAIPNSEVTLCKLDLATLVATAEPVTKPHTEEGLKLPVTQGKALHGTPLANLNEKRISPIANGLRSVAWGQVIETHQQHHVRD